MEMLHQQCHDAHCHDESSTAGFHCQTANSDKHIVDALKRTLDWSLWWERLGWAKSRLALEAISDLQAPNVTTYFCNLTDASSELGIAQNVATVIGRTTKRFRSLWLSWECCSLRNPPSWYWTT